MAIVEIHQPQPLRFDIERRHPLAPLLHDLIQLNHEGLTSCIGLIQFHNLRCQGVDSVGGINRQLPDL